MKKFYPRHMAILLFSLFVNISYGQNTGIYQGFFIIDTNLNVTSNEFFDLQASTGNPDFIDTIIGTYSIGNRFVLRGTQIRTFNRPSINSN